MKWNFSYCISAVGTSAREALMKKVKARLQDCKILGDEEAVRADPDGMERGS